jgi:hypothetical protein
LGNLGTPPLSVDRALGYIKLADRWVKPEQLAAEKQEAIRQKQADQRWRTKLVKLRDDLKNYWCQFN